MKKEQSSVFGIKNIAYLAIGGYVLWANRFRVQRFLESNGIKTPWMTSTLGDAVQSGAAKVAGTIEHEVKAVSEPSPFASRSKLAL